jgi:hypothetical protein
VIVLHEGYADAGLFGKRACIETFEKKSALVTQYAWFDDEHFG